MTIGISKIGVEKLLNDHAHYTHVGDVEFSDYMEELDPWLLIDEDTPRDRPVHLYMDKGPLSCRQWVGRVSDGRPWPPTHWKELPADPVTAGETL